MNLASYLQESFASVTPHGWRCATEYPIFPANLQTCLGFSPRADVLLENSDRTKRLWIEFEISRADPGANHLKFAVGHIFLPQPRSDTFVSMVSNHVTKGRANLGAGAILLMRHVGMSAFQIPLLPHIQGKRIKELNHLASGFLSDQEIDAKAEMDRALAFSEPLTNHNDTDIYYAANEFEVAMNVRQWNQEVLQPQSAALWGQRTITYFVFEQQSSLFAPSKFCAFMPTYNSQSIATERLMSQSLCMTLPFYCSLDQATSRFDGQVAQKHLRERLGYRATKLRDFPKKDVFLEWIAHRRHLVRVRADEPVILAPREQ